LTNVIAIAAGEGANLALKRDGTVGAWGVDRFGEQPVPAALTNVVAVAAGRGFGLAVTIGTVPASVFVRQEE
jgi:alpha-tubulin suppressor-like RCC1 family protein